MGVSRFPSFDGHRHLISLQILATFNGTYLDVTDIFYYYFFEVDAGVGKKYARIEI